MKMDKHMEHMPKLKSGQTDDDCVAALVVFNNEGANRCLSDTALIKLGGKRQPRELQFAIEHVPWPRPCGGARRGW